MRSKILNKNINKKILFNIKWDPYMNYFEFIKYQKKLKKLEEKRKKKRKEKNSRNKRRKSKSRSKQRKPKSKSKSISKRKPKSKSKSKRKSSSKHPKPKSISKRIKIWSLNIKPQIEKTQPTNYVSKKPISKKSYSKNFIPLNSKDFKNTDI